MSWLIGVEILVLFVLPVLLMYEKIIPYKYRFSVITSIGVLGILMVILEKWTFEMLGFYVHNVFRYFIPYFIFTFFAVSVFLIVMKLTKRKPVRSDDKYRHLHFLFIPVSFVQEFMFRSILIPKLDGMLDSFTFVILANALLFALIHVIYSNDAMGLILIFLAGLAFASVYYFYPNLVLITVTHSIMNYLVILYGFFFHQKKSRDNFIKEVVSHYKA